MTLNEHLILSVGLYEVNTSILAFDHHVWIVDPGAEPERILAACAKINRSPTAILLTHGHFDHIGGIPKLQQAVPNLPVYLGPNDTIMLTHPLNVCGTDYPPIPMPANIRDAHALPDVTVLDTPGHTPGGVCYYFPEEKLLLSGDTLFAGSVGRTDFPGGDMATLMQSLQSLKKLPPETRVIPGHGPETTIGRECATNAFLR